MKKALLLLSLTKQKLLLVLHMTLVASVYNSTIRCDLRYYCDHIQDCLLNSKTKTHSCTII